MPFTGYCDDSIFEASGRSEIRDFYSSMYSSLSLSTSRSLDNISNWLQKFEQIETDRLLHKEFSPPSELFNVERPVVTNTRYFRKIQ
jgi:hypothetical protein